MVVRLRAVLVTALLVTWLAVPVLRLAPASRVAPGPDVTNTTAVRGLPSGPRPSAIVARLAGAAATPVAAAPAAPRWAPAATAAIHPGVRTETHGGGVCTSDFVFTAGGAVYLGQAAHCAGTGPATETDGCTSTTRPVGTRVTIVAADGTRRPGTLAYSSWVTMQARHESDPAVCAYNDLALVRIAQADVAAVNPSVPFFGGPTGVAEGGLAPGALAYTYGSSPGGLAAGIAPKVGVSAADVGSGYGHAVYTLRPGVAGDSGSAFLAGGGAAVGLLATLNPPPVSNGVTDLAQALRYADAHGGLGHVDLALGTEAFTPDPAGVDPVQLATPAGPPLGS